MQLLLRFYDPTDGNIRVNADYPMDAMNVRTHRQQISVVDQEPVRIEDTILHKFDDYLALQILFNATIRENIRYGNDNASFDDIENAARQAHAHDFIMSLPYVRIGLTDHLLQNKLFNNNRMKYCNRIV